MRRRIRLVAKALKRLFSLRSLLALGLMFWCAGAGCMMVSYARAAVVTDSLMVADIMDAGMGASKSMDSHACCKARHRGLKPAGHRSAPTAKLDFDGRQLLTTPSTPPQSGAMNCCPLTSGSIVVTSRSQSNDNATVLQQTDSSSQVLIESSPSPVAVPLRLPNRAHSYLLDCAFLI